MAGRMKMEKKRCLAVALLVWQAVKFGRNERIRTSDPFVPNEVRYQAAPHSDISSAERSPFL
jgi:hypothetical protein